MRISFGRMKVVDFKAIDKLELFFNNVVPGCHSVRGVNKLSPRLGSNGASKSSLFDALCFALYGRTARGLRSASVVPWGVPNAVPQVNLEVFIDAERHDIHREASPHSLLVDGKHVEQKYLDDLLRLPFKVFSHAVLFAQGEPLFLDLQPTAKLALISEVHDLDRFDEYSKIAAAAEVLATSEAIGFEKAASSIAGSISAMSEAVKHYERLSNEFDTDRKTEIAGYAEERNKQMIHLRRAKDDVKLLDRRFVELRETANAASERRAKIEADLRIAYGEHGKHEQDKVMLSTLTTSKAGAKCSRCGQPITAAHIAKEAAEITARLKKLPAIEEFTGMLADAKNLETTASAEWTRVHDEMRKAIVRRSIAEERLSEQEKSIADLKAKENPYGSQWKATRAKIIRAREELKKALAAVKENEAVRLRNAQWKAGFKEIKLMVIDSLVDTLSVLTTSYASSLGLDCEAVFAVDRETKSGTTVKGINITVDGIDRFESWSGGEGQRLRLAASLALGTILLNDAGIDLPFRVLDEPSAHLSPEGLKELSAFLTEHGEREGLAVYLVDQRPVTGVTSTLTVTRSVAGVVLS